VIESLQITMRPVRIVSRRIKTPAGAIRAGVIVRREASQIRRRRVNTAFFVLRGQRTRGGHDVLVREGFNPPGFDASIKRVPLKRECVSRGLDPRVHRSTSTMDRRAKPGEYARG
jgi:hypothetical protein